MFMKMTSDTQYLEASWTSQKVFFNISDMLIPSSISLAVCYILVVTTALFKIEKFSTEIFLNGQSETF